MVKLLKLLKLHFFLLLLLPSPFLSSWQVNVYTPVKERISSPLPVMFWMYGGAYIFGDGYSVGLYDGSYLTTRHDVILVTMNFRLGPFGFLYIEGEANGNQAIEDQRLALQWVIDNIAK